MNQLRRCVASAKKRVKVQGDPGCTLMLTTWLYFPPKERTGASEEGSGLGWHGGKANLPGAQSTNSSYPET